MVKDFYLDLNRKYKIDAYSIYPKTRLTECAIRSPHNYIIGPEGELYTCWEHVGEESYRLGKIANNGDVVITNENLYYKYKNGADFLEDRKCLGCFFFPVCDGGCPEKRILNEYSGTNFELCCIQKDYVEEILDNHYKQKISL